MEISGYIPVSSNAINQISTDIKIFNNKFYVEGKETNTKNKYAVVISTRCVYQDKVPDVDGLMEVEQKYDHYQFISRGISITTNDSLDIVEHDSFTLITYTDGNAITIPANTLAGLPIVNILENATDSSKIEIIKDKAIDELEKIELPPLDWDNIFKRQGMPYADIYLKPDFSAITNGKITEEEVLDNTSLPPKTIKKQVWKGDYPLDKLVYVIQSNLDLLTHNKKIEASSYGALYAQLFASAMQYAALLEQSRLQAYEQASQFEIKTQVEYYLGVISAKLNTLKSLAEYDISLLNKGLVKSQIKLYDIQAKGFKANNIYKLFNAQLDGASTAFSAGMLETPPATNNSSELMTLYSQVGSDML